MFLEFNCGHFGTKMESLRPSYQKLAFCPYKEKGVAQKTLSACRGQFPPGGKSFW